MSDYVLGKGSELYLGADATTELVLADKVGNLTNIGEIVDERNVIDVDLPLDADTQEVVLGAKLKSTFTVTGLLKDTDDNDGYEILKTAYNGGKPVKFGIVRPGGLVGVGGLCVVHKVAVGEATNEGLYTFSADITTTGAKSVFTKPIA